MKKAPFVLVILLAFLGLSISRFDANAQVYFPGADFVAGPDMNINRMAHLAATLPDGRVVLFGGHGTGFVSLNTAEVWDAATNSFTTLTMNYTHDYAAIAKLTDGQYLIAGGSANLGIAPGYNTAEIYNPSNNTFTPTSGTMIYGRMHIGTATLTSGKVLVVGGWYDNTSATYGELYDPTTGMFTPTGSLITPRALPMVLPTHDGKAVVFGGLGIYGQPYFEHVELYDPATNNFSVLQDTLFVGESGWITLINVYNGPIERQRLSDGRYLLLSYNNSSLEQTLFTFDPATNQFAKLTTTPALPNGSSVGFLYPPVVDQAKDMVYLLGNITGADPQQIRLYTFDLSTGTLRSPTDSYVLPANYYVAYAGFNLLSDGRIFITGGSSSDNFNPINKTLFVTPVLVTSVDDNMRSDIPTAYQLSQNYPNPFNPVTKIEYHLPGETDVRLLIYDLAGRLVRTLVDERETAGRHVVDFDAGGLASGAYFYRIEAGRFFATRKMVFVK